MPSQYNITIQKPNGESSPPHTIKEGETLEVGRKQRKDDEIPGQLKLDSKVVSRKHAEFRVENGKLFLRDLGSSSGTFLNGERISEISSESDYVSVHGGDEIQFGEDCEVEGNVYYAIRVTVTVAASALGNVSRMASVSSFVSMNARSQVSLNEDEYENEIQGDVEEEFSLVWRDLNVGLNPQIQQYLAIVKPFVNSLQSMGIFGQEPPERQAVFEKHLNSASLLKESSVGVPGATKKMSRISLAPARKNFQPSKPAEPVK